MERPLIGAEVISDEEIRELRGLLGEAQSHRLVVLASAAVRTTERARALLKRIEWSGTTYDYDRQSACPECEAPAEFNMQAEDNRAMGTHKSDCELAAIIGTA